MDVSPIRYFLGKNGAVQLGICSVSVPIHVAL
jgi:hypothetical protein